MGCKLSVAIHPEKILNDIISPTTKRKKDCAQNTSPTIQAEMKTIDTSRTSSDSSYQTLYID